MRRRDARAARGRITPFWRASRITSFTLENRMTFNGLGDAFRATAYSIHPYRYPSVGYV